MQYAAYNILHAIGAIAKQKAGQDSFVLIKSGLEREKEWRGNILSTMED